MNYAPRPMEDHEIPVVTRVWHDAWHEAHDALVPDALVKLRTFMSFGERLQNYGNAVRAIGPVGAPFGFCMARNDQIDQLFLAPDARGTGAAATLLADGEARLAREGTCVATLDCAVGNKRARRFYERCGWKFRGEEPALLETSAGPFELWAAIYEKAL